MRIRFTTKLTLGLVCLFGIVLAFGITGIVYIYQQHNNAQLILRNNHRSLIYARNMDEALLQMASSGPYSGKAAALPSLFLSLLNKDICITEKY